MKHLKQALALLLALLTISLLPAALAEETETSHAELYDPEALLAAFQQLQADNVLYADYPLVESDIDGSDASMGVLAKYSVANSSTALNYVTGRVTVFSDPMAEVLGTPPERTQFVVSCIDNGENGEWMYFTNMYGEALQLLTGDDTIQSWLVDQTINYLTAFSEADGHTKYKETYEGDGFTITFSDTIGGFAYSIDVTPAE